MFTKLFAQTSAFRARVHNFYDTHPRFANGVTGFLTFGAGDIIAQRVQMAADKDLQFNFKHPFQIGLLGFVSNGVILTSWYNLLERVLGTSMKCQKVVFSKVFADQLIYAPSAILIFFGYTSMLSEPTLHDMQAEFVETTRESFVPTFLADCTVWPIANWANFRIVPLVYRPAFTSLCQLLWQGYMSFVAFARHPHPEEELESKKPQEIQTQPLVLEGSKIPCLTVTCCQQKEEEI